MCNTCDRKEARTANMRLASCGVTVVNSSAVFQINFSAGLTVLCSEIPHERQAQKRYRQPCFAFLKLFYDGCVGWSLIQNTKTWAKPDYYASAKRKR